MFSIITRAIKYQKTRWGIPLLFC